MTTLVLIMDTIIAVLMIVLALPLLKNEIEPNNAYGVRIPKSLTSPENWYRINHYGAKQLILWSVVCLAGVLAGCFLKIEEGSRLFWAYIALPAVTTLGACLAIVRFARKV